MKISFAENGELVKYAEMKISFAENDNNNNR